MNVDEYYRWMQEDAGWLRQGKPALVEAGDLDALWAELRGEEVQE